MKVRLMAHDKQRDATYLEDFYVHVEGKHTVVYRSRQDLIDGLPAVGVELATATVETRAWRSLKEQQFEAELASLKLGLQECRKNKKRLSAENRLLRGVYGNFLRILRDAIDGMLSDESEEEDGDKI